MYDFSLHQKSGRAYGARGMKSRVLHGGSVETGRVPANLPEDPLMVFSDPVTGARFGLRHDSPGTLFLAKSGGGKTNAISLGLSQLLPALGPDDTVLILDTKGDYFREFGGLVPEKNRHVLGCGEDYESITDYWNLFGEIMPSRGGRLVYDGEKCDLDALEAASTLLAELRKNNSQPEFPEMTRQLLGSVLIWHMRKYWKTAPEKLNNRELGSFLGRAKRDDLVALFDEDFMSDQRSILSYIGGKSKMAEGVQALMLTVRTKFPGAFGAADPQRECSMRRLIESPCPAVIFLEYDIRRADNLSSVYTLLIDMAMKYALGGRMTRRHNLYVFLDEFKLLTTRLHYAANALSFGRSQGVRLFAGLQNISVLEEVYGKAGSRDLLAGFQNIVAFAIEDEETRKWLSERSGENYIYDIEYNERRPGHCIEDSHIQGLGLGDGIVKLADSEPFFFHFPLYTGAGADELCYNSGGIRT